MVLTNGACYSSRLRDWEHWHIIVDSVQQGNQELLWQHSPRRYIIESSIYFLNFVILFSLIEKLFRSLGLSKNQKLEKNIITPTTKAADHDVPVTPDEVIFIFWKFPVCFMFYWYSTLYKVFDCKFSCLIWVHLILSRS